MAYTIQAVIGHKDVLGAPRLPLTTVELAQGYVLVPLTIKVREEFKIPFCPLTDGDGIFPVELIAFCAELSSGGALAYIEAEFFGGEGTQAAAVFREGVQ
ncbi:hypothetical protein [Dyella mobilis]|uniref:Uncharacterized protein n=1 Tax=Dyella mobilis TaxID=1849582 RepID=A0ABS2KK34_9GAMM|nr:hypothetical protein [Dyella mobilis]MBM7131501.1 hypothetical protein [Dyella mobilis]GLQ96528.1 hypothetical protein GCM10007863_09460 [Dyella mobilis]